MSKSGSFFMSIVVHFLVDIHTVEYESEVFEPISNSRRSKFVIVIIPP